MPVLTVFVCEHGDAVLIRASTGAAQTSDVPHVSIRCPACGHQGAFGPVAPAITDAAIHFDGGPAFTGQRQCPNPACKAIVFVVRNRNGMLTASYPPEILDFDPTDLPPSVRSALEEAVKSHAAECYKASAMMVRKAMEEMCQERQAEGNTLKDRIAGLKGKVILPEELFVAADELRLLGNDAAHVAAREYDEVGKEEVEVGIALAKEILKAVYQYKALLARMRALKSGA